MNIEPCNTPRPSQSNLSAEKRIKLVCNKIEEGNIRSATRLLVDDVSVASPSKDTLNQLIKKHPPEQNNFNYHAQDYPPFFVSTEDISEALQSFPNGSSGSVDSLTPQHLKDMFLNVPEGVNKDRNLSRLSNFFYAVINQDIPSSIRSIFFGARLLALNKKCGGIRPIAIGNCLRRMAAKLINKYANRFFKSHFLPFQFGAGAKCGTEYVIHSTRSFVENNPKAVIIKIDFANAFNCVDRSWLLSQANKLKIPGLKFILNAYDQKSSLFYNDTIIESQSSTRRPFGPFSILSRCSAYNYILKVTTQSLVHG